MFPHMTVAENLEMGCYLRSDRRGDRGGLARAFSTQFPRLAERRQQSAGTLSGGEQQMLAIGRALMSRPKLIMFDEPSLGLAPNIVERTFDIITGIRDAGTTVLMVEQNASAALDMCDHAYLLEIGLSRPVRCRPRIDRQPTRAHRLSRGLIAGFRPISSMEI